MDDFKLVLFMVVVSVSTTVAVAKFVVIEAMELWMFVKSVHGRRFGDPA